MRKETKTLNEFVNNSFNPEFENAKEHLKKIDVESFVDCLSETDIPKEVIQKAADSLNKMKK